ncbi:MAG: MarR family winged helix-turn-helix transcriptional regulator [Beutenbergiaceae bacterium]
MTDADASELLMQVAHRLRRRWMASLEPWDLAPHEFRALRVVAGSDGARLSDIADRLRIANRSVTDVIDTLEHKGLVERSPSPADRRAVVVRLTANGVALEAEIAAARVAVGSELLQPLSDAETATLRRLLGKLVAVQEHGRHQP